MLAEKDPRDERRRSRRSVSHRAAMLRTGDLTLTGDLRDHSVGGAFLATQLLIEVGEHGLLTVGDAEVAVQVVWLRGNAHEEGPGMGLSFDDTPERRDAFLDALDRDP